MMLKNGAWRWLNGLYKNGLSLFLGLSLCWLSVWLLPCPFTPSLNEAIALDNTLDSPTFTQAEQEQFQEEFPFWIWLVLPQLFPEYLDHKGGYLSLGFAWEPGAATPTGIERFQDGNLSKEKLSCQGCHHDVESVKNQSLPLLQLEGVIFDHQRYHQFLVNCVQDPRFTADYLLAAIDDNYQLPWLKKQIYRWFTIPQLKTRIVHSPSTPEVI